MEKLKNVYRFCHVKQKKYLCIVKQKEMNQI